MYKNELNEIVPPEVAEVAFRRCHGGTLYVYKDGKYGAGFPSASVGGAKASRFRSDSYKNPSLKVNLGSGWVAFRHPTRNH